MNGAAKMIMIANRGREDGQRDGRSRQRDYQAPRNEYNGDQIQPRGDYEDMESRRRYRRDDRGRFRSEGDMNMGDDDGRDSRGMDARGVDPRNETDAHYPMPYPHVPPIYERQDNYPRMNRIGFASGGELEREYRTNAEYPEMDEMGHKTSPMTMGHGKGGSHKLTKEMADEWMENLQNEDGTRGPHWKIDQVRQVMAQRGIDVDPVQFYAVLNMIYSDYCKVLRKHGMGDRLDVYVDLACAWMNDKDAVKDKAGAYYECAVKH